MQNQIKGLTRQLLSSGVFHHLSDNAIARLQWLLIGKSTEQTGAQLMNYWYMGNYYSNGVPQDLLYNCNILLMQAGKPVIEVLIEQEADY